MRSVVAGLLSLTLLLPSLLPAQSIERERSRMNRVVVAHELDERGYVRTSGWVVAVGDSSLILDTGERFVRFDRHAVTTIELRLPPNREFGIVGVVAGAWLLSYIVIRHRNENASGLPDVESSWVGGREYDLPAQTAIGAAGAVPGGLLGMVADGLLVEVVHTWRADRQEEWDGLRRHFEEVWRPWQIGLHTGLRLWNQGDEQLEDRHASLGEPVDRIVQHHGSVQWLRRASLHYRLSDDVAVGAEWIDLTWPVHGSVILVADDTLERDERDLRHTISTTFDADGYGLSVMVHPPVALPAWLDLRTGVGAGVAVGRFREELVPHWWDNPDGGRRSLSEPLAIPFLLMTTELTGRLTEGLSLGISADATFLLPYEVPEVGPGGVREGVWFGSGTVGVVVRYGL